MAASKGRDLKIKKGATVLAGVRTKGIAIAGEPIDITTDDDLGYRTLLEDAGQMSLDVSIEGVTKDNVLKGLIVSGGTLLLTDITIVYPDGGIIDGDFFLASLEESGAYNDAITFTGALQSSGAWTYTPPA